jgi:Acyl-CoA carboxylase epsilon subunit
MSSETDQPVLRVVRGNPTPEEVAALVAVLAAVGGSSVTDETRPARGWSSPAARLRSPAYGTRAGGWRASALPR